jgi:hypothetical protein
MLQTTIHRGGSNKLFQNSDDHTPWMRCLVRPSNVSVALFSDSLPSLSIDNHTLLALDLYHSNTTSEASYEYIRAATSRCFPDVKLST